MLLILASSGKSMWVNDPEYPSQTPPCIRIFCAPLSAFRYSATACTAESSLAEVFLGSMVRLHSVHVLAVRAGRSTLPTSPLKAVEAFTSSQRNFKSPATVVTLERIQKYARL